VKRTLNFRSEPTTEIELFWEPVDQLALQARNALYLCRKLRGRKVLYIGKSVRQTIKGRFLCPSKDRLARLAREEGVSLRPLVAGFHTSRRLTPQLIDDVERLLIYLVEPCWNVRGKNTCRLHHRDLVVRCSGEWPHPRTSFEYHDDFPLSLIYRSE
jgi:hypothetical protein